MSSIWEILWRLVLLKYPPRLGNLRWVMLRRRFSSGYRSTMLMMMKSLMVNGAIPKLMMGWHPIAWRISRRHCWRLRTFPRMPRRPMTLRLALWVPSQALSQKLSAILSKLVSPFWTRIFLQRMDLLRLALWMLCLVPSRMPEVTSPVRSSRGIHTAALWAESPAGAGM